MALDDLRLSALSPYVEVLGAHVVEIEPDDEAGDSNVDGGDDEELVDNGEDIDELELASEWLDLAMLFLVSNCSGLKFEYNIVCSWFECKMANAL